MTQTATTVTVDGKTPSDTIVLKRFFFADERASVVARELSALTGDEKGALAAGIRNETYTYV